MDIGQRIREVREELGMPVTVLARRAGAAPATIYRIESGNRTPSMALLEKIAKELRVPPSALMQEPSPLGDASRDEFLDGLRAEVLEDSLLALYPGVARCIMEDRGSCKPG